MRWKPGPMGKPLRGGRRPLVAYAALITVLSAPQLRAAKDITHGGTLRLYHYAGITFSAPDEPKACEYLDYCASNWQTGSCTKTETRATVKTLSGGNWLGLVVTRPWLPGKFCVYLKPEGIQLKAGDYWGITTLESYSLSNKLYVNTSLKVCAAPAPKSRPAEIEFSYRYGFSPPARQNLTLGALDSGCPGAIEPQWAVSASTESGGNWLAVETRLEKTPTSDLYLHPLLSQRTEVYVRIPTGGLKPGTYVGAISASCTNCGASGPPKVKVPVRLHVQPPQGAPAVTAVLNGASLRPVLSPGAWITIHGDTLSTGSVRTWRDSDFKGLRLPPSLEDVRVSLNGIDAAVQYVSPRQVNALLPPDVPLGPAALTVSNSRGSGVPVNVELKPYAPEFFRFEPVHRRYVAATTPEGTLVGGEDLFGGNPKTQPAKPGRRILLYGTGFGPTQPSAPRHELFSKPLPLDAPEKLVIRIGSVPATVEWAGLVAPGVYQFNVIVPDLPSGEQLVKAEIDGVTSEAEVYVIVDR